MGVVVVVMLWLFLLWIGFLCYFRKNSLFDEQVPMQAPFLKISAVHGEKSYPFNEIFDSFIKGTTINGHQPLTICPEIAAHRFAAFKLDFDRISIESHTVRHNNFTITAPSYTHIFTHAHHPLPLSSNPRYLVPTPYPSCYPQP